MTQKSLVCGLMCFGDFIKIYFINSFCCVRILVYDVYMMPFKIPLRICVHEAYWEGNNMSLPETTILEI